MRRTILIALVAIMLTACSPWQVRAFNSTTGQNMTVEEATEAWCEIDDTGMQRTIMRRVMGVPHPHWPAPVPPCPAPEPPPPPPTPIHLQWPWAQLAQCESGGNWYINTGNGYYGGLKISITSWGGVGGTGYPHQHSPAEQVHRAQKLQAIQGWGAWPACSLKIGLR